MRSVRLAAKARADLESIFDYIAKDSPAAAIRMVDALEDACLGLAGSARRYPLLRGVEELNLRQRLLRGYRIIYRIDADVIYVVRVLHGARDYESLLVDDG